VKRKFAFTLIELLVVIAIIAILAAILFPVFAQAKAAAKKTADLSNTKQYVIAEKIYEGDTDDYSVPSQYNNSYAAYPPPSDAAPGTILKPYMKNFDILRCPTDPADNNARMVDLPDPNSMPDQATHQAQYELNLSFKADYGLNVQYFSKMGYNCGGLVFKAVTIPVTSIAKPAETIYIINSIWDRSAGGSPRGGGNWALDMPCRFYAASQGGGDSSPVPAGCQGYWWFGGWNPNNPLAWNVFGGVWPWHFQDTINIGWVDGHAKSMKISQVTAGCDVQPGWQGLIFDKEKYLWDTQ